MSKSSPLHKAKTNKFFSLLAIIPMILGAGLMGVGAVAAQASPQITIGGASQQVYPGDVDRLFFVANGGQPLDKNSITVITQPSRGTLTITGNGVSVDYRTAANISTSGSDSFTLRICATGEPTNCANVTRTLTFFSAPHIPIDDIDTNPMAIGGLDNAINYDLDANQYSDGLNHYPINWSTLVLTQPANGTVTHNGNGVIHVVTPDTFAGSITFTAGYCRSDAPTICVTQNIKFGPIQQPIAATDFTVSAVTGVPTTINVTGHYTSPNPANDQISQSSSASGTVTVSGMTFIYTSPVNFVGTDSFQYRVFNNTTTNTDDDYQTITVNVNAANAPADNPDVNYGNIKNNKQYTTTINVPATANIELVNQLSNGSVSINRATPTSTTATATFSTFQGYVGSDSFQYRLCSKATTTACTDGTTVTVNSTGVVVNQFSRSVIGGVPTVIKVDNQVTAGVPDYSTLTLSYVASTPADPTISSDITLNTITKEITYTPKNFDGYTYISYYLCETGNVGCAYGSGYIYVTATPFALEDKTATGTSARPVTVDIFENHTGSGANTYSSFVKITNDPAFDVVYDPDFGTVTVTSEPDYVGDFTLEYSACSYIVNDCDTAQTVFTFTDNSPPTLSTYTTTQPSGYTYSFDPKTLDADVDSTSVNILSGPTPINGTATVNSSGVIEFASESGKTGVYTITYEACDYGTTTACTTADAVFTLTGLTLPSKTATVGQEQTATVDLLTGVTGGTPDPASIVIDSVTASSGSAVVTSAGILEFTASSSFVGFATVDYTLCDTVNTLTCSSGTVTFNVTLPPIVVPDATVGTFKNTSVDVDILNTTTGAPADEDSFTIITDVQHGLVSYDSTTGLVTYAPDNGYTGTDTLTFSLAADGQPLNVDQGTITFNVTDDPSLLIISNSPITTNGAAYDEVITFEPSDLTANRPIDFSNATVVTSPTYGVVSFSGGNIVYTVNHNITPTVTDSFTINVCVTGEPSNCYDVQFSVEITDGAPLATITDRTIEVDSNVSTANFNIASEAPDFNTVTVTSPVSHGVLTTDAAGVTSYKSNAGYIGVDSFTYEVCRTDYNPACDSATVTFHVLAAGDMILENKIVSVETGDTVTVNLLTGSTNGIPAANTYSVTTDVTEGSTTYNPTTGVLTYISDPSFEGTQTVTYLMCEVNSSVDCDEATITFNIVNTPEPAPIAYDGTLTIENDEASLTDVVALATITPVDPALVTITTAPASGTATVDSTTGEITFTPTRAVNGTFNVVYQVCSLTTPSNCDTGTLTYVVKSLVLTSKTANVISGETAVVNVMTGVSDGTPDPDSIQIVSVTPGSGTATAGTGVVNFTADPAFTGTATIEYIICKVGEPNNCETGTITILVQAPPLALEDKTAATTSAHAVTTDLDANATGQTPNLSTFTVLTQPANGTVAYDSLTGVLTYTSTSGYVGTVTVSYRFSSVGDATNTDTATLTITVTANPAPATPVTGTYNVDNGESTTVDVSTTGGDDSTVTIVTQPTSGTATVGPNGNITYTSETGENGTFTVVYQICATGSPLNCTTGTLTFEVSSLSLPTNATVSLIAGNHTNINLFTGVTNGTPDGNSLVFTNDIEGVTTSVNPLNGDVYIEAAADTIPGNYNLEYKVCVTGEPNNCETGILPVLIIAASAVPVLDDIEVTVPVDETIITDVAVASNVDSNTVTIVTQPESGDAVVLPNGDIEYTPERGVLGTFTIVYNICVVNEPTNCANGNLIVEVTGLTYEARTIQVINTKPVEVDLTEGITGGDVDPASVELISFTENGGSLDIDFATGIATYTPDANFVGVESLSYLICKVGEPDDCAIINMSFNVVAAGTGNNGGNGGTTPSGSLPNTGSNLNLPLIGSGLLLMLLGFGAFLIPVLRRKTIKA